MLLCLNMMDEAQRKGIQIDVRKTLKSPWYPVVRAIGTTGKGLKELFIEVLRIHEEKRTGKTLASAKT